MELPGDIFVVVVDIVGIVVDIVVHWLEASYSPVEKKKLVCHRPKG